MAKRQNWDSWFDFILSCLGYMVGLGNVWRFPYICFRNGGGTFVIVYFICVILIAVPIIFMEVSLAQYSNLATIKVWQCCPLFQGIGFGMVVKILIVSVYYTVIISWTLYYFSMSFSSVLPWASCKNKWNTPSCFLRFDNDNDLTGHSVNQTEMFSRPAEENWNISALSNWNMSLLKESNFSNRVVTDHINQKTPTEEFWEFNVLKMTSGIEDLGYLQWPLTLCLLASWVLVFLALFKGIKSSAKVMYFAATIPYLLLLVLFIKGLTLPGSLEGIRFFIIPKWEKFLEYTVWTDAAAQAFYSVGIGGGMVLTISSFNKFNNNCYRDAMILPVLDGLTSLFAGFVVFSTLGYMSHVAQVDIENVVKQGPGIAFMVYPEALSTLPLPQFWSAIFFLTLFLVGMDSQIGHVQSLTTNITDCYPSRRGQERIITLIICALSFLPGIIFTSQGGMYILQLLDHYLSSLSGIFMGFLEVIVICWVYGTSRLYNNIEMMIGYKPHRMWIILWKFICPVFLFCLWILSLSNIKPVKYGKTSYPTWAMGVGWIIAFLPFMPLPFCAVDVLRKTKGSFAVRLKASLQPSSQWIPAQKPAAEYETVAMKEETSTAVV